MAPFPDLAADPTLLVIPPGASPDLAHHVDTADTLFAALDEDTAVQGWEVEGGRIPAQAEPVDG